MNWYYAHTILPHNGGIMSWNCYDPGDGPGFGYETYDDALAIIVNNGHNIGPDGDSFIEVRRIG